MVGNEITLLRKTAVNVSRHTRRQGTYGRPPARKQHDHDQLMATYIVEGAEPAQVRVAIGAGAGLAGDGFILLRPPRRAEFDGAAHPRLQLGDQVSDIQLPLHTRRELGDLLGRAGILEVIEGAAVRQRGHQCGQLQRRLGDLFAKAGEHAHAAVSRRRGGKPPWAFAGDVQAGLFAIAEQVRVIADFVETQFGAQSGEIEVVRVRQRLRQVIAAAPKELAIAPHHLSRLRAASATETLMVEQG